MLVIVATPALAGLEGFIKGLSDSGAEVVHARSGMAALEMAKVRAPVLLVVGGDIPDFRPFELVSALTRVNAAINSAVMSPLTSEQFHEDSEGLGILTQIAPHPGEKDALDVMAKLMRIL